MSTLSLLCENVKVQSMPLNLIIHPLATGTRPPRNGDSDIRLQWLHQGILCALEQKS